MTINRKNKIERLEEEISKLQEEKKRLKEEEKAEKERELREKELAELEKLWCISKPFYGEYGEFEYPQMFPILGRKMVNKHNYVWSLEHWPYEGKKLNEQNSQLQHVGYLNSDVFETKEKALTELYDSLKVYEDELKKAREIIDGFKDTPGHETA